MNNNALLRQGIEDTLAVIKNDDKAIQTICQLLNVKYPLNEQAVQNDLTHEEARKQVFDKVKNWEGSECHNFVLGLEALGLLKLKEETEETTDFICISSLTKGDTLKTVYVNHALINHIGDKLREKCKAIFGTFWSNDVARVFARTAITEYELQKAKDNK